MTKAKWVTIRRRGEVVAWIEMFWCLSAQRYVTIPGVSGYREAK